MPPLTSLSIPQARRIALAAQGFLDTPAGGAANRLPASAAHAAARVDRRHLRRVLGRLGLLQMDSVNVLQRAHYLPLYSRLGPYPTELLDRAAYRAPRDLFEYWGHEASLLPVALHPYLRWRMARVHNWAGVTQLAVQQPKLVDWVRQEVLDNGPLTAAEVEADAPRRTDNWGWNWSDSKTALEWLFWRGEVLVSRRNSAFARVYDAPERVLPPAVLATPTPAPADAYRELVRLSAAALGVATEPELRDYFRLPVAGTRVAIPELVEAGELVPVSVEGWRGTAYLHRDARLPRWVRAGTLLSPFDPVVWNRDRTQRLFDFTYRIEIYTPAPQRTFGYYVLPFLLGDRLVARVDLKADRSTATLLVPAAWAEPTAPPQTAAALAAELHRLAEWLGLERVAAPVRGDLAAALGGELSTHRTGAAGVG